MEKQTSYENVDDKVVTFNTLITLGNIFYIMGWIIIVIGASAAIMFFDYNPYFGILGGIGIIFLGIFSLAFGELIKLFLQIETNTRKRRQ
jgi:hypothetical protein